MTKAEAALLYASWGWHVLPVVPNGKVPATQHGHKDATTDPEQIARWWAQNPDYNVGIAAGARSGLIVFDVDPRNGGDATWEAWLRANGQTPDGAMQMTAGGGEHHLGVYDPEIRSCKLGDGLDLLADGRYFLAYPSTIEGRSYEWEASSDPFVGVAPFSIPDSWMASYRSLRKAETGSSAVEPGSGLIKGSRNNGLTALGGAMRRHGFTEAEIMAALSIANETRCEMPLPASELTQIVKSVARYEPESDVGANVALGSDAADAILDAIRAETRDYFFTRATSYLSQPAPLKWIIKGWIPDSALCMVYGESGAGKTFVNLDMACHIAAGLDWHGHATRQGVVIYMAGEGNYGIRQRVASWCKAHNVTSLDNLLISNKSVDVDSPHVAAQIINAVMEIHKGDACAIFVDTVNNHMTGNENEATDTRHMVNASKVVASAFNATVCFTHHTGNSIDAKNRARGSSAWKASMDAMVLVSKKDDLISIKCTKMKDAKEPEEFFGALAPVLLGWIDEDGEEVEGAVFVQENNPPALPVKKESEHSKDIRKFSNAWLKKDSEIRNNLPYLSRSELVNYLIVFEGLTESTANTYVKESKKGRLIYNLLNAQIIEAYEHGWIVTDNNTASSLMMMKNAPGHQNPS